MINLEHLNSILTFDNDISKFRWRKLNVKNQVKVNSIAGGLNGSGYWVIRINKRLYREHHLVWLYYKGYYPKIIDHINGNPSDNRIENLREVSVRQNGQNRVEHREGHLVGTTFWKPLNKWKASIRINGKKVYLGYFNTQQEAHEAYLNKLKEL